MSSTEPSRPSLGADVTERYRPVSARAIVAIVLALLSILAFASPFFWILPPFALAASIWASRYLDSAREEYAGQFIAKLAILLSLITGMGSVTQYYTIKLVLAREARAFADSFLDRVLANQPMEAFYDTIEPWKRQPLSDPKALEDLIIRNAAPYRQFLASKIVAALGGRALDAQVTYMGVVGYGYRDAAYIIYCQYHIVLDARVYEVVLELKGGTAQGGESRGRRWFIANLNSCIGDITK